MTTALAPLSRQRPYPYDAYVDEFPVILKPGQDDNLVGRKSKTLDATAPSVYDYSSQSPYKERVGRFRDLFGGMGLGRETLGSISRYSYAERCDLSINGKWFLGPRFETHVETINAGAGAVRQIIQALHGGTLTVFAICDNGVYRRVADNNWVASLTSGTVPALGAGEKPQSALRFKGNYAAPVDGLYLGTSSGNLWQYNGATWVQAAAAQGPGTGAAQGEARWLEVINDEFWVAGDYWVVKADNLADPLLRASYSGVIYIGDQHSKISYIKMVSNILYIFKQDGRVYTVDNTGECVDLFPSISGKYTAYNGRNATVWLDKLWAPLGDTLVTLDGAANLTPDGLDRLIDNTSPVRGKFVAGAGHNHWFMYEIYYNEVTNTSYMVKHGTWITDPESQISGSTRYIDTHHGAIALWNKEASAAQVVHDVHVSSNDRMYVGFTNGTVEWCVLPLNNPDPTQDSNCEFTGLDAYVYFPDHHAKFEADNKLWQGVSVFGTYLSPDEYVQVEYKVFQDSLSSWIQLEENGTTDFTYNGQRINFPSSPPTYSRVLSVRVKLLKDTDLAVSPANLTPILEGVGIHESVRPSLSIEWTFNILASSYNALRNGRVDRRRGSYIREQLLDISRQVKNITIILPTGESEEVAVIDYDESWRSRPDRRDLEWTIQMIFVQVRTLTDNPINQGITYDSLEAYTLDELEGVL